MKTLLIATTIALCSFTSALEAQKGDTVLIQAKNLLVSNLKPGNSRYLVYFQKGKNAAVSDMQIWNIRVEELIHNGKAAISISQKWDYKDTVTHLATSICDKADFRPLYHESWWKGRGSSSYNPANHELVMNGSKVTESETSKKNAAAWSSFKSSFDQYYLNWHLDLETFSMLPLRKNITFLIPFYEFGYDQPRTISYSVVGESELMGSDNKKVRCWLLKHEEPGNVETFWISKETSEVLKLEQLINDQIYRYKVKLPF